MKMLQIPHMLHPPYRVSESLNERLKTHPKRNNLKSFHSEGDLVKMFQISFGDDVNLEAHPMCLLKLN